MKVKMYLSREEDGDAGKNVYVWFGKMNGHAESSHHLPYGMTPEEAEVAGRKIASERGNEVVSVKIYRPSWLG